MSTLRPDQRATAEAYAQTFAPTPHTQAVLDDLTVAANSMNDPMMRAGATNLLLHILLKRSALRREKQRNGGK